MCKKVVDRFQYPWHSVPMPSEFDMDDRRGAERLLRVNEAARMLAVSGRTVWRMISAGQLKPVRFRKCTRVVLADVSNYLKAGKKVACL